MIERARIRKALDRLESCLLNPHEPNPNQEAITHKVNELYHMYFSKGIRKSYSIIDQIVQDPFPIWSSVDRNPFRLVLVSTIFGESWAIGTVSCGRLYVVCPGRMFTTLPRKVVEHAGGRPQPHRKE